VDAKRLLDVRRNEVIVTIPAARAYRFRCLGRKFGQALHGTDVCLLLCCGEGRPWYVSDELHLLPGYLITIPAEPEYLRGCSSCTEQAVERLDTAAD